MALREGVKKRFISVGIWTFFIFYFSMDYQINLRARGVLMPIWQPLYYNLVYFCIWALLSVLIIRLARWLSGKSPNRLLTLLVHLPLCLVFAFVLSIVQFSLNSLAIRLFGLELSTVFRDESFRIFSLRYFTQNIWIYAIIVGVISLIDYYRLYRENELRSARLEVQLAQSQLQALKMQIQPHFLFNTINSILALMPDDIEAAEKMALQLSDFLRYTLDNIDRQEVLLKEEIDFVQRYLDIEKVRLQDRLTVTVNIDPETLLARVPSLMLQPIVENSIRHGIVPYSRKGRIDIGSKIQNSSLWIQVRDDGPGFPAAGLADVEKGVGLSNIETRLKTLYEKPGYRLTCSNHPEGGAVVDIVIPLVKSAADGARSDLSRQPDHQIGRHET